MLTRRTINSLAIGVGLCALAWLVFDVGPQTLVAQLVLVGPAFPLVLLVEAASNAASTMGWLYAFDPRDRPSYRQLLTVTFASFSVAGTLPTGQAGEVAKWNLMRGMAANEEIVSSLLVYNYLHVLTTLLCVFVGPVWALAAGGFPANIGWTTLAVTAVMLIPTGLGGWLLYRGILGGLLRRIGGWSWVPWTPSVAFLGKVADVDARLSALVKERPGDLLRCTAWLAVGRVFSVVEIWVILRAMGTSDSFLVSVMVFSATAVVNYLLMVLPAREGFLEASTLGVFKLLGMRGADGLSLELTRRLRKIVYQVAGIALMVVLSRTQRPDAE